MARIDNLEHFLEDIASSIKTQLNDATTIYPSNFDTLILQIGNIKTQPKTITPSTSEQVVTPDEGFDAFSTVTVNAVDNTIDANIIPSNIRSRCRSITVLLVHTQVEV